MTLKRTIWNCPFHKQKIVKCLHFLLKPPNIYKKSRALKGELHKVTQGQSEADAMSFSIDMHLLLEAQMEYMSLPHCTQVCPGAGLATGMGAERTGAMLSLDPLQLLTASPMCFPSLPQL